MAKKLAYDKVLFTTVVVLVGIGLTAVFSASAAFARDQGGSLNLYLVKQAGHILFATCIVIRPICKGC